MRPFFGNERGRESEKVPAKAIVPEISSCDIDTGEFNEVKLSWNLKGTDQSDSEDGTLLNIYRTEAGKKAQLIDLSETLFAEGGDTLPRQTKERPESTSAEEVIITVEDEPKAEEQPEQPAHRPFGWIRRK